MRQFFLILDNEHADVKNIGPFVEKGVLRPREAESDLHTCLTCYRLRRSTHGEWSEPSSLENQGLLAIVRAANIECENVDVAGLTVGAILSLTRLKASKDLNGRVGKLTGFNYETGCWQDKFHKGRFKNVKPANLYWSSRYCCEP
jgi:hypothetical protein